MAFPWIYVLYQQGNTRASVSSPRFTSVSSGEAAALSISRDPFTRAFQAVADLGTLYNTCRIIEWRAESVTWRESVNDEKVLEHLRWALIPHLPPTCPSRYAHAREALNPLTPLHSIPHLSTFLRARGSPSCLVSGRRHTIYSFQSTAAL